MAVDELPPKNDGIIATCDGCGIHFCPAWRVTTIEYFEDEDERVKRHQEDWEFRVIPKGWISYTAGTDLYDAHKYYILEYRDRDRTSGATKRIFLARILYTMRGLQFCSDDCRRSLTIGKGSKHEQIIELQSARQQLKTIEGAIGKEPKRWQRNKRLLENLK